MARSPLCFAYYCSGHGYGHATRVSAFARHLLNLNGSEGRPVVYIVSSAPEHVFADSIACGARYRFAEIDPVIVQPLAYRVDRRKSVEVLKTFLSKKNDLLQRERQWLLDVHAHCVLSDAAFLGCLAARAAGLPSVLITNFSFDSVYSYLSTPIPDDTSSSLPDSNHHLLEPSHTSNAYPSLFDLITDDPIPPAELAPLVAQVYAGYRCAELLVRLPGHIPMPSFFVSPPLPSFEWVDVATRRLKPDVMVGLKMPINETEIISGPPGGRTVKRAAWQAPLLVRSPQLAVYTPDGRAKFLNSIGVPVTKYGSKILIVSFGGQVFKRPGSSRGSSRTNSRNASHENIAGLLDERHRCPKGEDSSSDSGSSSPRSDSGKDISCPAVEMRMRRDGPPPLSPPLLSKPLSHPAPTGRLATPNHIYIPGAPPASKPLSTPSLELSTFVIPPTPPVGHVAGGDAHSFVFDDIVDYVPRLLPDDSWIAVVCGVSKAQWAAGEENGDDLPDNFYVAPREVYMPDLTAVGDVLLGKLGYGTVSECVDSCTPFVYVSRPLFVEEHGLRLLLDQEGVGVELAREAYEAGEWSEAVAEAFERGRREKERKRQDMALGIGAAKREEEGRDLARRVVEWATKRITE